MQLSPFNISILNPDEYIQRKGILPVSSNALFETASRRFHPEGFFSEVIFGQIGTNDRLVRRGYIDLRTTLITPHLYRQLITLKSYYGDILAGRTYAYFDEETHDFIKTVRDDPKANTGYAFFLSRINDIQFAESPSVKRKDKIDLINKFRDRILMTKLLVIPAGVRDVHAEDGRVAPEEINKIYMSILALTQALPDTPSDNPIFDSIRYQLQTKVQEVYTYILNILTGKSGYLQGKFTHRHIVYGNRNVITPPILSRVTSSQAPNKFGADEIFVPLFQGMKAASPLVAHKLKLIFFDTVFNDQTNNVPLIDPDTFKLNYYEVETSEIRKYITSDGLADLINGFRDVDSQKLPVTIQTKQGESKYLQMVYDDGTVIYTFRNIDDFYQFRENVSARNWSHLQHSEVLDIYQAKDYALVGSGAIAVLGGGTENADIDVVLRPEIFEEVKKSSDFEKLPNGCYRRKDNMLDVYNEVWKDRIDLTNWSDFLKNHTVDVEGHHVASPQFLIGCYTNTPRIKDTGKLDYLLSIVVDRTKIRPMTRVEMFYIAAYSALHNLHATATRHPVLVIENIQVYKVHLLSTQPGRIVKLRALQRDDPGFMLPEYPVLSNIVKTSMSVGPWTLEKYDGRMVAIVGCNTLYS